jgi:hypothetical protein
VVLTGKFFSILDIFQSTYLIHHRYNDCLDEVDRLTFSTIKPQWRELPKALLNEESSQESFEDTSVTAYFSLNQLVIELILKIIQEHCYFTER